MDSSSDEDSNHSNNLEIPKHDIRVRINNQNVLKHSKFQGIVHKLFNRQTFGTIHRSNTPTARKFFEKIPPRLRFCLLDIVQSSFLENHVFMGFSQCGQYLLSFTYSRSPNPRRDEEFREQLNFRLHFLSWVPGQMARLVHSVPLFDDDCVDSKVSVSIAQWKHNPSILVVYGIAELCTERSYLSIIGVPRLGCRKCKMQPSDSDLSCGRKCIEHNFAVHTKFYCTSDTSMCEPVVQLAYSNQIIIYTDFIHILEIDYVKPELTEITKDTEKTSQDSTSESLSTENQSTSLSALLHASTYLNQNVGLNANKVVQNILADFADIEAEPPQLSKPVLLHDVMGQELCIQASISHNLTDEWEGPSPSIRTLISPPLRSPRRRPGESMSRFTEMHRIAEMTYEFVEETEPKCEKLSTFRKKRLADKKYEFSEDNNENIVPYRVLRSNRRYFIGPTSKNMPKRPKSPPMESVVLRVHNRISSTVPKNLPSTDESEYRVMALSEDGSMKTISVHDNTSKTLSDYTVHPQDPYLVHSGNSKCSKQFSRYFVESDDEISSIITDSEDDCISGYHVALPLVAHGAWYAPLQAVGAGAWERLVVGSGAGATSLPPLTLRARQRSLDIELLCNEVCMRLCRLHTMKFVYCFDWGCHVLGICPTSGELVGVCAMWVWALAESDCGLECKANPSIHGCLTHRRQYAAQCMFGWDLMTGVYRTQRASLDEDNSQEVNRVAAAERAKQLAINVTLPNIITGNENRLLTTLTGRSLKKLTDVDNCIEITKNHPFSSDSESSTDEDSDSD